MRCVKSECRLLGTVIPLWLWLQQGCVLPPGCSARLAVGQLGLEEEPPHLYAFVVALRFKFFFLGGGVGHSHTK